MSSHSMDYDDSYEDDGPPLKVALYLGDLPKVADVPSIPRNGFEFIALVMDESSKYEDVKLGGIDTRSYDKNQTIFCPNVLSTKKPKSDNLMPSLEWQLYQVADYSDLRQTVSTLFDKKSKIKTSITVPTITHTPMFWNNFFTNNEPLLSTVVLMDQKGKEMGIRVILNILQNKRKLKYQQGLWLYSLMAVLKIPLSPGTQSLLRELAIICSELRNEIPEEEDLHKAATPFNLIICLVARYFNQGDLIDKPNNDVLRKILNKR